MCGEQQTLFRHFKTNSRLYYLTRETQVFEETSQSLIEVCQLGHAVFALTALLIVFQGVKVLCGHGAFVFAHILPIG